MPKSPNNGSVFLAGLDTVSPYVYVDIGREIVDSSSEYQELIYRLLHADPNETFQFSLNNVGGDLQNGTALINAIVTSAAEFETIVTAPLYSMGAILACVLIGKSTWVEICDHTFLMFHLPSTEIDGTLNNIAMGVGFEQQNYLQQINAYCSQIMTEDDVIMMSHGADVYICHEDFKRRGEAFCGKLLKS